MEKTADPNLEAIFLYQNTDIHRYGNKTIKNPPTCPEEVMVKRFVSIQSKQDILCSNWIPVSFNKHSMDIVDLSN
jgi:hypothetical protein